MRAEVRLRLGALRGRSVNFGARRMRDPLRGTCELAVEDTRFRAMGRRLRISAIVNTQIAPS
jgi:hypothetical protein